MIDHRAGVTTARAALRGPRVLASVAMLVLGLAAPVTAAAEESAPSAPPVSSPPAVEATVPKAAVPTDPKALLAELYQRLKAAPSPEAAGPFAAAIEQLWLASGSDTADLLLERATTVLNLGDRATARRLLDTVVELQPDYAEAWNRRAFLNYGEEKLQAALVDLGHALARDPNHFHAMEGLARILRELDQKELALKAYRRLAAIHPNAEGVKDTVEALEREVEGQKI